MSLGLTEYASGFIIVVTGAKAAYDFWWTGRKLNRDIDKGVDHLDAAKEKKKRDDGVAFMVFGFITAASVLIFGVSAVSENVELQQFDSARKELEQALAKRAPKEGLDALTRRVEILETLDPTGGGGPGGGTTVPLIKRISDLEKELADIRANYATEEQFKELIRIVAELRKAINKLNPPAKSSGHASG